MGAPRLTGQRICDRGPIRVSGTAWYSGPMRQRVRRLIAVMVGLVGAMALAGCDVTGTITVRADDLVDLNLRVIVDEGESCEWNLDGLRTSERRNRGGGRLCLLQGTVPAETLRRWGIDIAHNRRAASGGVQPVGSDDGAEHNRDRRPH